MIEQLIDTHCHLSFPPLENDYDGVLDRAAAAGVGTIIVPAYDHASWADLERISQRDTVYPAFGLHPWCSREDLDLDELGELLERNNAVAIGEIGLDFKIDNLDRERQMKIFSDQLSLSIKLDLPVILHCRGAFDEFFAVLKEMDTQIRGVMHAYSRGPELANRLTDNGLHLGFGGAITRDRARRARRSAELTPVNRILLETDAPSIGLDGVLPEDTEPRHIHDIAMTLAEIRGSDLPTIVRATTANARRLFGI